MTTSERRRGRLLGALALLLFGLLAFLLVLRSIGSTRGPELQPWHRFAPDEMSVARMEAATWPQWIEHENRVFEQVRVEVVDKAARDGSNTLNRYAAVGIVSPSRFATDWNRSFVMEPVGEARGVVVLLHGLTDSPYSLRHIATHYRERGFIAIGMRMPGHGTTPAGLTRADIEDWQAATRLVMREAARRRPAGAPLEIVGYSNGGAQALAYALQADGSEGSPVPTRLVLLSPMIGVSAFARFSGIAGLPALLPRFAKSAWLDVLPEFNPFKYNSFPVHAARQSWRMTDLLDRQLRVPERTARLPPVLVFQSVLDETVSTGAVLTELFDRLPENGSALVLFDVNRAAYFEQLLKAGAAQELQQLLPVAQRAYDITVVTNSPADGRTLLHHRAAGTMTEATGSLEAAYPIDMFSLSHIAVPFPMHDSLYGRQPRQRNEFGLSLGTVAPRGERGMMLIGMDALMRASSNPFFDYLIRRIDGGVALESPAAPEAVPASAPVPPQGPA